MYSPENSLTFVLYNNQTLGDQSFLDMNLRGAFKPLDNPGKLTKGYEAWVKVGSNGANGYQSVRVVASPLDNNHVEVQYVGRPSPRIGVPASDLFELDSEGKESLADLIEKANARETVDVREVPAILR